MDPDVTLREIRELCADGDSLDDFKQLVSKFEALDGWLSSGGFLPLNWDN